MIIINEKLKCTQVNQQNACSELHEVLVVSSHNSQAHYQSANPTQTGRLCHVLILAGFCRFFSLTDYLVSVTSAWACGAHIWLVGICGNRLVGLEAS